MMEKAWMAYTLWQTRKTIIMIIITIIIIIIKK